MFSRPDSEGISAALTPSMVGVPLDRFFLAAVLGLVRVLLSHDDASVAAVNQGGKRKGAACIYLETWHADIEEFLELRDNTGD